MKHLIKTIFGLSIAALLTVFISCPQPSGPGGAANSPSNPQTPPPQTPVEKALGELTINPVQIYKNTTKVELPTTTSVAGVTITWTAEPTGYIKAEDPDRGKILKREPAAGTEKTEVTLTAKATKDGEVKTKTFKITIYPATVEPDAQALASSLACPASVSQDFTLPKNVSGYPTATITWTSADDKIIKIETVGTELKGIVGYDLIDRTVKLTATVHYNSGIGIKEFNVTVDRVSEIKEEYNENDSEGNPITVIKKYEFNGTELVITETKKADNVLQRGVKYTYTDVRTASDGTKTAVFQKTANYNNGSWKTSQQDLEEVRNTINKMLTELEKLKNKSLLTLQDFREPFSRIFPNKDFNSMSDTEFFGLVKGNIGLACSYEEFTAFSDADKSAKLKDGIERTVPYLRQQLPLLTMNNVFPAVLCAYSFERGLDGKLAFAAVSHYDSGKPWYEQKGMYIFDNTESPSPNTIRRISFRVGKNGPDTYDANIMIEKTDGSNNPKNYDGTTPYTPGGTSITATLTERNNPSDTIAVTISGIPVPSDGTMSAQVQIDGGTAQPYTLKFQGYFFTR